MNHSRLFEVELPIFGLFNRNKYICGMKQYKDTNYYITETGEVYNNKTKHYLSLVIKKDRKSSFSRAYISLFIEKKQRWFTVARLVAELYIPNTNNYPQVNHIDGNPLNNHKDNLEWVTQSQNIQHAIKTGLKNMTGINNHASKLNTTLVEQARADYNTGNYSLRQLAIKYHMSYTAIRYAINGKTWK